MRAWKLVADPKHFTTCVCSIHMLSPELWCNAHQAHFGECSCILPDLPGYDYQFMEGGKLFGSKKEIPPAVPRTGPDFTIGLPDVTCCHDGGKQHG
jgi:hypothetical protein